MGLLVRGQWQDQWYDTSASGGRFERAAATFRDWVRADGSTQYAAEPGRYHLYVSYACPWACRTLIIRMLKQLEQVIDVSVVHPINTHQGWSFEAGPQCTGDRANGAAYLHQIYAAAQPDYTGRVTVPVLWDTGTRAIVNNESAEIMRMLNSEFDEFGNAAVDFYPPGLRDQIDAVNAFIYQAVNNGVYRAGFATTQMAYEEALQELFDALDSLEARLSRQQYLVGDRLTEADWRLFTTLVRFDAVYHGHFKCNLRRLVDYPRLAGYTRELYQVPGVAATVNFDHIKRHYYGSHPTINPHGIVPRGPLIDFRGSDGAD
jgi:putative glutathione S-transferase